MKAIKIIVKVLGIGTLVLLGAFIIVPILVGFISGLIERYSA